MIEMMNAVRNQQLHQNQNYYLLHGTSNTERYDDERGAQDIEVPSQSVWINGYWSSGFNPLRLRQHRARDHIYSV